MESETCPQRPFASTTPKTSQQAERHPGQPVLYGNLTVPVVLSSRPDPPEVRLPVRFPGEVESTFCCSPQPESACCPTEVR